MKKPSRRLFFAAFFCLKFAAPCLAAKTSAALSLLEASDPRTAALGEAATALTNHAAAFLVNPSLLATQKTAQAQLSHRRGYLDDSFSQVVLGLPTRQGGWGMSLAAYDGGTIDLIEGGSTREVRAQRDLVVGLATARHAGPLAIGITGKFFSSELAETDHATAWAADLGFSLPVNRFMFGVAVQNMGTRLQYISSKEELPLSLRLGTAYRLIPTGFTTDLLIDGTFRSQRGAYPAVGIESRVGPLVARAGYRGGPDGDSFSVGTGFAFASAQLDYSFGLVNRFDSAHRIGVSFRWGDGAAMESPAAPVFYPLDAPTMTVPEVRP